MQRTLPQKANPSSLITVALSINSYNQAQKNQTKLRDGEYDLNRIRKTFREKTLSETELTNLPDKELKAMVVKILINLTEEGINSGMTSKEREKI